MTLQDLTNPPALCSILAPEDATIMANDALADMVDAATHQAALDQIDEEVAARKKAEEEYKEKDLECDRLLEAVLAARGLAALLQIEGETLGSASRQQLDALTAALALVDGKPVPLKPAKKRRGKRA